MLRVLPQSVAEVSQSKARALVSLIARQVKSDKLGLSIVFPHYPTLSSCEGSVHVRSVPMTTREHILRRMTKAVWKKGM